MLGVDEGGGAAHALRLGDDVQRERGLARRLRAVDLGDAAARDAADAERDVERQRAGRDDRDLVQGAALPQAHDRALAELAVDGREGQIEGLAAVALHFSHGSLLGMLAGLTSGPGEAQNLDSTRTCRLL